MGSTFKDDVEAIANDGRVDEQFQWLWALGKARTVWGGSGAPTKGVKD
jgi:hypothetical protein